MNRSKFFYAFSLGLAVTAMPFFVFAQKNNNVPSAQRQLLKRVVTKSDKASFGAGGTVTVVGAPTGSVTVVGWNKNEVEVTAEIELQAENEADLAQMAQVNGIVLDPGTVHLSILTMGMHDKEYMKKTWKKFPKQLLSLPWKIDYVVHVPSYTDLEVTVGKGAMKISGVEGAMQLKASETDADLQLSGGMVNGTFGSGTVNLRLMGRSWRGRNINLNMASGNLNVIMPKDFNADIDATVIRNGEIQNTFASLKECDDRDIFTPKSIKGRAGTGGAQLAFVMGDGVVKISEPADQ
jgi:hypothetical protein